MLHKYSIEECIEQCNKFDAENGVDDYNESILYYLQKYRDIKNSGGNGGYNFACGNDYELFEKNAGIWMDADMFYETMLERDEFRTCVNCKSWNNENVECENDIVWLNRPKNVFLNISDLKTNLKFGCNRFESKQ